MNLQNLVNFYKIDDIDMFEGCTVPSPLDIDQVKNWIMYRCGLLTPIYSEPMIFKMIVKNWFDAHQWTFNHLCAVLEAEYSPIENVYESDHWSNQRSGTDTSVDSGLDKFTHGEKHTLGGLDKLTHGETHTLSGHDDTKYGKLVTHSEHDDTENTISADNSSAYEPDHKQVVTYGHKIKDSDKDELHYGKVDTASGTDRTEYGKTDTASGTDRTEYGKHNDFTHGLLEEYDRLRHGNIGVTTNNQLINQELEMLHEFQVYDWIALKFEEDNFIQVY